MRKTLVTAITLALAGTSLAASAQSTPATPAAQVADSAAQVTTQLPRTARPSHYAVQITPYADKMTFDGKVRIDVQVLEPTQTLVLQAANLAFGTSTLSAGKGKPLTAKVSTDADAQTASFAFDKTLAPGKYVLSIDYSGVINTQANGLFALDYATADGQKRALYTQFENSDARRFIPSWDEPDFKATFDLAVTVPAAQMAVSNMPIASSKDAGNGMKQVVFATTPKMSTYLLFFGLGDFDRATLAGPNGTEIGVIAQKGKVDQAKFALESGRDVLKEYNAYFGVDYPLPKLDNIAAPGQSQFFSAMENWGAIFTFEYSLLLDPAVSNVNDEQRVFTTAAHEIAHQWFGDLVTMAWWDDLWLNEGFATWMEGRTTAKLHPEWDIDKTEAAYTSRGAMGRDAYATTHPVVQHVATVEQASQAFDGITYGKGSAVIGMLEDYVGSDNWRSGVRSYIKAHAYGNAVTDELWREVDKAAPGKDFIQVAHDFTLQPGVPLIKANAVCASNSTTVTLEQGEFTLDRPNKTPLRWNVPVTLRGADGKETRVLVQNGSARVTLPGCQQPVVINAGQKGYYRTLYAPAMFQALSAKFSTLPVVDQLGVIMDAGALSSVGLQPVADQLDLTAKVPLEASPDLWLQVAGVLGGVDGLFDGDAKQQAAWRKYAIARLSPKFQQLGWDNRAGDPARVKQLRSSLIGVLSNMGDAQVIAEARRRFAAFQADPKSLSPDLRRTVLGIVARNADAATWDTLHAMAKKETSSMVRDQYYSLLAYAKDPVLAQRALDMALTDEPGATNAASMIGAVSQEHADLAFDFAVSHREKVDTLVDSTSRARYYPGLGSSADDLKMVAKIKAYADKYIAPTSRRAAETVMTSIQTRVKLQAERRPQVVAWLKQQK
ncbi:M1 family metallopeptidase [Pseudoxanthomonas winnipegensis]|uniref:M1 family metallopeptidase n=1 Tax=Pseudoxanthomonas winnipegensis TaxID=2480810 RepID=UPI00257892E3|nr:M1 family metallopeptidase [Pseudoxanthomonas winnipegensis]WJI14333.1 M1 family metallopeptidase [Pseudoxanthomonas winnipegensis]